MRQCVDAKEEKRKVNCDQCLQGICTLGKEDTFI